MGFHIEFKDIVDIFLVAILLYQTFRLLKRTGAINIFIGVMAFVVCWLFVSLVFKMELLGGIFDRIISVGSFALIVLFQEEIRRFFSRIGSRRKGSLFYSLKKFFINTSTNDKGTDFDLVQIVLACRNLSKSSTGALIILTRNNNLDFYVFSGEQINANINSRLIENIFFKNSPLHDGALIVSNRKLKAAACILPVSKNQSIPKRMGLRHRAALGVTEHSDAIAIVVSEETGQISYAVNGQLTINLKPEQLEHFLSDEMSL
jgi:uncharacterized protein (TIGR00159 family)